jgi:hypothetical protein
MVVPARGFAVLGKKVQDGLFAGCADQAPADLSGLKMQESRDVLHSESQAEAWMVIGIDFHDLDLAGADLRDLQQHRVNDVTGLAPRRPERDEHGASGLQDLRFEIRLADKSQTQIGVGSVHIFDWYS